MQCPSHFLPGHELGVARPHLEYCSDFEDHLANLRSVYNRFREFHLKFKPKKCALFQRRVEFLGRRVSPQDVEMGDSYVEAIRYWPAPHSTKGLERFFGFANYHRGLI